MKLVAIAVAAAVLSVAGGAAARPSPVRRPSVEPAPAHQLRDPASTWPAEPEAPAPVDPARFRAAWAHLCSLDPDAPATALAADMLSAATAAGVDPFLLAALATYPSGCNPKPRLRGGGVGLLAIDPDMYLAEGAPPPPVERARLARRELRDPAANLAVGARLLKMWQDTHAELDATFGGAPHRSAVSHFIWGDEVRSSGQEDLILTARRRAIAAYTAAALQPRPSALGIPVVSPLEAPPRVATSGPGEERDNGARRHRGLDITATLGEPVHAIAGGTVMFAGVNLVGHPRKGEIPPERIARYAHRNLGAGGIYVCIEHDHDPPRHIVSCYMHLASYVVNQRDTVQPGQIIGFVGRTGVKVSPPHLHLEVRVDDRFTNPVKTLGDLVIPPRATMTHRYMLKAKRAKRLRS
jgi:murein DD-endopeptidase MepM/ murein hydrolase activator NlpD